MFEHQICNTVTQLNKMLGNLDAWLQKASEYAVRKGFEVDVLVDARLTPDMYSLAQQVQSACDYAKLFAARLSGRQPPSHPDSENTIAELQTRVATVRDYLSTFTPDHFVGAAERIVALPFVPGYGITGSDYYYQFNVPNTYFHLCMAYAILRHNGVELGKANYIGPLDIKQA